MQETPNEALLNRAEHEHAAHEHFSAQLALLDDVANYGSNLVIRAFGSSPKGMAELVVCAIFLKQVVAMVDAVRILLAAGASHAALLPTRSAFEASVYLDWIVAGNAERRGNCYIVGNYRDERLWVARATPGTLEHAAFDQIAKSIGLDILGQRPNLTTEATAHLKEVDRILAQPALAAIDLEFEALRGRRKRDPEWYELEGMKSIRQIAGVVGRLAEYETFYSRGSQVTHSGSYKDHVRFKTGTARLIPIRHLASANLILSAVMSAALASYKRVVERYRSGEAEAFRRKYTEDWRDPFQNARQINYDF